MSFEGMKMVNITLIGESQAKDGAKFYFMGPQKECDGCKLRSVCLNLNEMSLYRISKLRDQMHDCALVGGKARVVEVEVMPQSSVVPKKYAMEGSVITFKGPECSRMDCKNYRICHPPGVVEGRKYSISKIEGNADCLIGEELVLVELI